MQSNVSIYQLPTINYQLPTINYQLPTINYSVLVDSTIIGIEGSGCKPSNAASRRGAAVARPINQIGQ